MTSNASISQAKLMPASGRGNSLELGPGVSELRYRRLFETAQDGILILDADSGKIIDVNPFLLDLARLSVRKRNRPPALGDRPVRRHRSEPGRFRKAANRGVHPLRKSAAPHEGRQADPSGVCQ